MKSKLFRVRRVALLLVMFSLPLSTAFAQGTEFTYQGRLHDGPSAANGSYVIGFRPFSVLTGGSALMASSVRIVAVTNGLFTTTLDFGSSLFDGSPRYLQLEVATNNGASLAVLVPRQPLTAAPYAVRALSAGNAALAALASNVAANSVGMAALQTGSVDSAKIADGAIVAADLNTASFNTTFWRSVGNTGVLPNTHFLGTLDFTPLDFRVNNQRALRLQPSAGSPNLIGGYGGNVVSNGFVGTTIGGGGYLGSENRAGANFATIGGGTQNTSSGERATVSGGANNKTTGNFGTVGGGVNNSSIAEQSTVGGGAANTSSGDAATVGGGLGNSASLAYATVGGGVGNSSGGNSATVPGGAYNSASGAFSLAAGRRAWANHTGAFVWADSTDGNFGSTANDEFSIRAHGGVRLSDDTPNLSFGAQTRQMLNLWGIQYGVGVQSDALYFRCDGFPVNGGFIWYKGGVHHSDHGNPGGGREVMRVTDERLSVRGGVVVDQAGLNSGLVSSASLTFGPASGEGIGSTRTPEVNRFGLDFYTGGINRMTILNNGNIGIGTLVPTSALTVIGNIGASGNLFALGNITASGSVCAQKGVNCASDRNIKAGFEGVDTRAILEKVSALSITRWHYTNDPATPHLGAVAQDFHAAFAVGPDDKHIATVDADGVALAAIQGLNQKLEADMKAKDARIAALERRLSALETLFKK